MLLEDLAYYLVFHPEQLRLNPLAPVNDLPNWTAQARARRVKRRVRGIQKSAAHLHGAPTLVYARTLPLHLPIKRFDAEGQRQSPVARRALEALDVLSKLLDTGTGVLGSGLGEWYVLYLFSFCCQSESDGGRRIGRLNL
jgi:hypothetical protein